MIGRVREVELDAIERVKGFETMNVATKDIMVMGKRMRIGKMLKFKLQARDIDLKDETAGPNAGAGACMRSSLDHMEGRYCRCNPITFSADVPETRFLIH